MSPRTLQALTTACFVDVQLPVVATFTYDADAPFEVTLRLELPEDCFCLCGECEDEVAHEQATFHFSRDLLDQASSTRAGECGLGDVRITRLPGLLRFRVPSLAGFVTLLVDHQPVRDFLIRSYLLVPSMDEHVDVDAAIEKILEGAS